MVNQSPDIDPRRRLSGFGSLYGPVMLLAIVLPAWPYYQREDGSGFIPLWEAIAEGEVGVVLFVLVILVAALMAGVFRPDWIVPPIIVGIIGLLLMAMLLARFGASDSVELAPAGTASLLLASVMTLVSIGHLVCAVVLAQRRRTAAIYYHGQS
ncbi:hypothetical protein [Stackebrandtia soli]|uniref:hypothetical protein n=1 Tax=Stackebrandtia soli TaxID=1892856 RepID=UPI0039EA980B